MLLTHKRGVWRLSSTPGDSTYDHKDEIRAAGFAWNGEKKVWYTSDAKRAKKYIDFADDAARRILIGLMVDAQKAQAPLRMLYADSWYILDGPYDSPLAAATGFRWYKRQQRWASRSPWKAWQLRACADGRCGEVLDAWKAEREAILLMSRAHDSDAIIPLPRGRELYPFQRAGVAFAERVVHPLIADEMGLGKTPQSIAYLNTIPAEELQNVLVVCPASLKLNWLRELRRWCTHNGLDMIVAGSRPFHMKLFSRRVVVINYETIWKKQREDGQIVTKLRPELDEIHWDVVILDEAHRIKNAERLRSQAVHSIRTKRRVALTGTPIQNRIREIWAIANWLRPDIFGIEVSKTEFMEHFAGATFDKQTGRYQADGASNLFELQNLLRSTIMIRREKQDVLKELPPKQYQVIEIPADSGVIEKEKARLAQSPGARAILRKKLRHLCDATTDSEEYRGAVENLAAFDKDQIGGLAELAEIRHETARAKLPDVIAHLKECLQIEEKVICFAYHRDIVEGITAAFKDEAVYLYGGMSVIARDEAVQAFQNDPKVHLFVGSMHAAGEGLTLTASSHVVFAELDWTPGVIDQAADRAHRITQTRSVLIQHLVLEGSLDAYIAAMLVEKQQIIEQALDRQPEMPDLSGLLGSEWDAQQADLPESVPALGQALFDI